MRIILMSLIFVIVLSSFVFAVSKTFDFSLTWPEVKYFGGSNNRVGFGPNNDFKNPYVVEEVRIDVGRTDEVDCGDNVGRFYLKHDGNVVYASPVLSQGSYLFPLSSPTIVDSIVFEKVSGSEKWKSHNTLDKIWSSLRGKDKGGNCWLTFSSTVKFSNPANYYGNATISNVCPDNCPFDLLSGKTVEQAFNDRGFPLPPQGSSIDVITGNQIANDNTILVWLGDKSSVSKQSTIDFSNQAFACLDLNKDKKCDYLNAEDCTKVKGDFYDFSCCMNSSNFLPLSIRKVSIGYDSVTDSVCGLDNSNNYKFAFRKDHQGVKEFSDPKITLVSNGSDFFDCGSVDKSFLAKLGNVFSFNVLNVDRPSLGQSHVHSYMCDNNVVFECPGNDNHLSQASSKVKLNSLGDKEKGKYCTTLNGWISELDNYGFGAREGECSRAGFNWTGNYCCGEPEDVGEYYSDVYDSAKITSIGGGCWNSTFVSRGSFVLNQKNLINYQGTFQGCTIQDPNVLALIDSYTNLSLVNNTVEGVFFKTAVPKTSESATCQPFGEFVLTKNDKFPARKDSPWDVALEGFNATNQYGYCASDQCWNMTSCVEELSDQAFYYPKNSVYAGQGFVCRP